MAEVTPLDLQETFTTDVEEMLTARKKSKVIHKTKDIDAAGDEVELPIRDILRRRLARAYHVSHGHVVDSQLQTTPQFDVIIPDAVHTPALMTAANGTEYIPYDSVFAVGETKSTFKKSDSPIQKFSDKLTTFKTHLKRPVVTGPHKTTLFSFMLFADGGDVTAKYLADIYSGAPTVMEVIPTVICILNFGILANMHLHQTETGPILKSFNLYPALAHDINPDGPNEKNRWVIYQMTESFNAGSLFGFLLFAISAHLAKSTVVVPDISKYINQLFIKQAGQDVKIHILNL